MEAKELRIGNYVNHNGFVPVIIDAVDIIHCQQHPEAYKPIELTEEWLLNFGFDNTETGWEIIYRKRFKLSVILFKQFASVGMAGPFGLFEVKLKYVHQLQNLFFSLTGEELTIKS
ncbi:hypothetical protein [Elizabethkingia anophelis]|uniref:hypothetical protein n=1 Tax=Elizabethkingia anophelis TaxID=1117645 RepID=UPI000999B709|nr:hypothetical protein [Elizabethkingia anophelis]OPC44634.1 hypothetical protein BAY05_14070 [Elizabethkingia anophelis]